MTEDNPIDIDPVMMELLYHQTPYLGIPPLDRYLAKIRHERQMQEIREMDVREWVQDL